MAVEKVFPCRAGETKPVSIVFLYVDGDVDRVGFKICVGTDVVGRSRVRCKRRSEPSELFLGEL